MNMPNEVFISFPRKNDQHSWFVRTNIGEIRYIRADLLRRYAEYVEQSDGVRHLPIWEEDEEFRNNDFTKDEIDLLFDIAGNKKKQ